MKKNILVIIILSISFCCPAQTLKIKYYIDRNRCNEVSQDKAKFSESIIQNPDGSITTEVKDLKRDKTLNSQTYKEEEPFGIWVHQTGNGTAKMDYNFTINYADEKCDDSISNINSDDYFKDNAKIGYKAPKISTGQKTLIEFIFQNIVYPDPAKDKGIQGKVTLMFTITITGNIENIMVIKGSNIYLDKEAVRVIRLLKFSNPPEINGLPKRVCVIQTISFSLE